MWKECKIIMLPTEKKAEIENFAIMRYEQDAFIEEVNFNGKLACGKIVCEGNLKQSRQELYVLSNDEIKEGDWCHDKVLNTVFQTDEYTDFKYINQIDDVLKIIAATDSSLTALFGESEEDYSKMKEGLLQIPEEFIQLFIQKYNSGEVIDKVLVEYEEAEDYDIVYGHANKFPRLLLNLENKITIKLPEEKKYSREEVIEIAWNAWYVSSFQKKENTTEQHFKQWIQENLK